VASKDLGTNLGLAQHSNPDAQVLGDEVGTMAGKLPWPRKAGPVPGGDGQANTSEEGGQAIYETCMSFALYGHPQL
jgi:hypothetical protein